jgi:hypothetical protein
LFTRSSGESFGTIRHLPHWFVAAAALGAGLSSDDILTKVADSSVERQSFAYSGLREYRLHNLRVNKEAKVLARVTYQPAEGQHFTILERSGSPMLAGILEKLVAYEADESRPTNRGSHAIGPSDYRGRLRGTEVQDGRVCYVMDITPKHNGKHLIKGTSWVDPGSYAVVRLDGRILASVSLWVGTPRIIEDFSEVAGLWLPSHTRAVASGLLLGTSELDIRYTDYQIAGLDRAAQGDR